MSGLPESGHCQETLLVTLSRPGGIFLTKPSSFFSSKARSSAVRTFATLVNGMRSKTDQLRAAWFRGDRIGALPVHCASRRGSLIALRGMDAHRHPDFYRQIGQKPQELITAALDLLAKRFDLR
jgi:hypothetical protein